MHFLNISQTKTILLVLYVFIWFKCLHPLNDHLAGPWLPRFTGLAVPMWTVIYHGNPSIFHLPPEAAEFDPLGAPSLLQNLDNTALGKNTALWQKYRIKNILKCVHIKHLTHSNIKMRRRKIISQPDFFIITVTLKPLNYYRLSCPKFGHPALSSNYLITH